DRQNAQTDSLRSDFGFFGITFWQEVCNHDPRNHNRMAELESLNRWRNAIAHQSFSKVSPGGAPSLTLVQVRRWRSVCRRLATSFDEVMRVHLQSLIGTTPWPP